MPEYQDYFGYRECFDSATGFYHTIKVLGVTFGFTDETLVKALARLSQTELAIVLMYYGLEKSDETICNLLKLKNRSVVQYHRTQAIKRLQNWMKETEEKYETLQSAKPQALP